MMLLHMHNKKEKKQVAISMSHTLLQYLLVVATVQMPKACLGQCSPATKRDQLLKEAKTLNFVNQVIHNKKLKEQLKAWTCLNQK